MKTNALLASVLISASCMAQTLQSYTTTDGLPSDNCRDVVAVGTDTVWIATQAGVAMYNGSSFTVHNTSSYPGLADNSTTAIEVAQDGSVWVGTDFGLSVYDGATYTTYTTADGLGDDQVKNIKQAPNGDMWIGTINGASKYSGGSFTAYGSPDIPFGGVNYFDFDSNGDVWMAGGLMGLTVFDGGTFSYINQTAGLISAQLRSIVTDNAQQRWVATAKGISVLGTSNTVVENHTTLFTLPPPDTLNPVEDIAIDSQGNVWAAVYVDYLVTEGGVSYYDGTAWQQFETSDGLAGPNVRRLSIDPEDDVWVATSTGLTKISNMNIGISEVQDPLRISVYPNPASEQITVNVDHKTAGKLELSLSDMRGRVVRNVTNTAEGSSVKIPTHSLPAGLYLLHVNNGNQLSVQQLSIVH